MAHEITPPPPIGQMMKSGFISFSLRDSRISKLTVACPAIILSSSKG
jgi:hypothetical protein